VEPYLFGSVWSASVDVYKNLLQRQDFNRDSTGTSVTLGHPLTFISDYLRLYATYRLEDVSIQQPTGGLFGSNSYGQYYNTVTGRYQPLDNLFNSGLTSAVRLALSWDSRNNRLFPTSGIYSTLSTEISDSALGSSRPWIRNEFNFRIYRPIWGPFVAKLNTQFGLITSRSPRGVPVYERYFLGGIMDVRGFNLQSLGPRLGIPTSVDPTYADALPQGSVFGGNAQFYYNFEIEFPLIESVGVKGVVFQDAGNAWNLERKYCGFSATDHYSASEPCGVSAFNLRTSVGFGFRWFSPLGPLRFEWGFPLIRQKPYEDAYQFQFTVGNAF